MPPGGSVSQRIYRVFDEAGKGFDVLALSHEEACQKAALRAHNDGFADNYESPFYCEGWVYVVELDRRIRTTARLMESGHEDVQLRLQNAAIMAGGIE